MRVVLTGASGQLGAYVRARLIGEGHSVTSWSGGRIVEGMSSVDLTDVVATARALAEADPEVIMHTAAISTADEVRRDPSRGRAVNVEGTARLAEWCRRHGRRLVYTSTDLVFGGSRAWNREDDPAEPVLMYGRTKFDGESPVLSVAGGLVARLFSRPADGAKFHPAGCLMSILGAAALLLAWKMMH